MLCVTYDIRTQCRRADTGISLSGRARASKARLLRPAPALGQGAAHLRPPLGRGHGAAGRALPEQQEGAVGARRVGSVAARPSLFEATHPRRAGRAAALHSLSIVAESKIDKTSHKVAFPFASKLTRPQDERVEPQCYRSGRRRSRSSGRSSAAPRAALPGRRSLGLLACKLCTRCT